MAKLTKKILKKHHIHNPWNLAEEIGNKLYITYTPADNSRGGRCAHWQVVGINIVTDPKAHWRDYGRKTFLVGNRSEKEPELKNAIAFVKEKYGLDCTEKDPFGAYQVVGTLAKIEEKIHPPCAWNKAIQEMHKEGKI